MDITNLKNSPQYVQKTLTLIEESFEYTTEHHFDVDFYPLYNKENFENCFILIENDEVIAHIGRLQKNFSLNGQLFPISMYGGIAVAEPARGKGYFKDFFAELLKQENDTCLSLLWSEKLELYERFEFFPCVSLKSYPQKKIETPLGFDVNKKNFSSLTDTEEKIIKDLYKKSKELRINRSERDWKIVQQITSAHVYLIYKDNVLINYFIKDKGQDLTDIIHEYGYIDKNQLTLFQHYGHVWTTFEENEEEAQELFGSLVKINNLKIFKDFALAYAQISISQIRHNFVDFSFEEAEYQLSQRDFLQGLFGPGRFEELQRVPPLYICGLDSI